MTSYITIDEVPAPAANKTRRWEVHDRAGGLIGRIQWWSAWRCYVFQPCVPTAFEQVCLRELATFVEARTREHRA